MLEWEKIQGCILLHERYIFDLVEIARSKYVEAEGASERPDAIKYLSVHCTANCRR